MVEPSFAERSLIYHKDYLSDATIVTSSAVNITEHAVLTADGHSLPYDYLIIATGHALASPASRAERIKEFQRGSCSQSAYWKKTVVLLWPSLSYLHFLLYACCR
jgi:hypothetical protein